VIIFATIFGVGFLLLIISLIFGHDTDVDADTDVHDGTSGPSVFSVKMISLIMIGFGAVSFGIRATQDATMFKSSMAGVAGAAVIGVVGYFIIRAFYASQVSSTITDQDLIGCTATVLDTIVADGQGQVACILQGREITYLARSGDGQVINRGKSVKVISKTGNIVTVEPIE
jgi:membrane protein implicated in regulation of membrane protease activity